jgi:hypothetical protein
VIHLGGVGKYMSRIQDGLSIQGIWGSTAITIAVPFTVAVSDSILVAVAIAIAVPGTVPVAVAIATPGAGVAALLK